MDSVTPKPPTSEWAKAFRERLRPLEWREVDGRPATAEELANAAAHVFEEMESGAVSEMREALVQVRDFYKNNAGSPHAFAAGFDIATVRAALAKAGLPASPASGEGKGE
jgi:hypothetical protein